MPHAGHDRAKCLPYMSGSQHSVNGVILGQPLLVKPALASWSWLLLSIAVAQLASLVEQPPVNMTDRPEDAHKTNTSVRQYFGLLPQPICTIEPCLLQKLCCIRAPDQ